MKDAITGRRGELLRFGKGGRSWFLGQMSDDLDTITWMPPEGGRSASEIISHTAWTLSAVSIKIAEDFDIELSSTENVELEGVDALRAEIEQAYVLFEQLVRGLKDEDLDSLTTLPPPARIQEAPIERILRIMAGFHPIHHAGQLAQLQRRAQEDLD